MLRALSLILVLATTSLADAKKDIAGLWYGTLQAGAIELRLGFQIERKDGKLTAYLDSVDQGARKVPMDSIEFADGTLTIAFAQAKMKYVGKLQADGDTLVGVLDQGAKLKLDLKRTDSVPSAARPQHPKRPYPYVEEEVTFASRARDVKLAGTLTIPKGEGPFPAVILISGSGPQDRDETLLGHKPFLVLADHLTRKGVAVLRYDDRGVGKSTGVFETATSKDFAEDTAGAVDYLKGRPAIGKIGLIGHSEGGLIAPLVAAENPTVGFVVLLAGPGLPGDEIVLAQGDLIGRAMGVTAESLKKHESMRKKLFELAKKGVEAKELTGLIEEVEQSLSAEEKKEFAEHRDLIMQQAKSLASPWFRFFLAHDPRPVLGRLKCPILALNGEKDLQVPSKENLEAIEKAARAGGNTDVTVAELKGLNHLFQPSSTGLPSEYGKIEETFSPDALERISDWILKRK